MRVDPLSVLSRHNTKAAETTEKHFLTPAQPLLDDAQHQVDNLLRFGEGHAAVNIMHRLGEIILVHCVSRGGLRDPVLGIGRPTKLILVAGHLAVNVLAMAFGPRRAA